MGLALLSIRRHRDLPNIARCNPTEWVDPTFQQLVSVPARTAARVMQSHAFLGNTALLQTACVHVAFQDRFCQLMAIYSPKQGAVSRKYVLDVRR